MDALEAAIWARSGKREGKEIRFLCPAHDDHKPSARWNPEKRTWFCDVCGSGGGYKDLAAQLGTEASPADMGRAEVAAYPYHDEEGQLLFEVVRFEPKGFKQRRPDGAGGWIWHLDGTRRVLYRLPQVLAAVAGSETVWMVEGEKDADSLARLGLTATTNPGGAGKWRDEYAEFLRGARVVILPDHDEPGRPHAQAVARSLDGVAATVKILELDGPEKDVSAWIEERREMDGKDLGAIRATLEFKADKAPLWLPAPEPDFCKVEQEPSLEVFQRLDQILADPKILEGPQPVVPGLAFRGRTTLLYGREKDGKSTLVGAAAAAVSAGAPFLKGPCAQGPVLWIGVEEHRADVALRLQRFGADALQVFVADRLPRDFDDVEAAARQHRPALLVIDTLASFAEELVDDAYRSSAWVPLMQKFGRIARESDCAVILIHHARKSDGAYRDSSAIGAGVDLLFELRTEEQDSPARHLKYKGRFDLADLSFRFDRQRQRFELTSEDLSLEERVAAFVEANPGCSVKQVRGGVAGRSDQIGKTISAMVESGRLRNDGGSKGHKLYVVVGSPKTLGEGAGTAVEASSASDQGTGSGAHSVSPAVPSESTVEPRWNHTGTAEETPTGSMTKTLPSGAGTGLEPATCPDNGAEGRPSKSSDCVWVFSRPEAWCLDWCGVRPTKEDTSAPT